MTVNVPFELSMHSTACEPFVELTPTINEPTQSYNMSGLQPGTLT